MAKTETLTHLVSTGVDGAYLFILRSQRQKYITEHFIAEKVVEFSFKGHQGQLLNLYF